MRNMKEEIEFNKNNLKYSSEEEFQRILKMTKDAFSRALKAADSLFVKNQKQRVNIVQKYKNICKKYNIEYQRIYSPKSYDETTLFCPAGMQRYKKAFSKDSKNKNITRANIQRCIRTNDIDLCGDGTHKVVFDMIGLFSFRHWDLKKAIDFFLEFIKSIGLNLSHVTIHGDKINEWKELYPKNIEVRRDDDCTWSDGEIISYCTEFYAKDINGNDIEIGNIVNPNDDCIDAGFGLDRLEYIISNKKLSEVEELILAAEILIKDGVKPSGNNQGYILRKILRKIDRKNGFMNENFFAEERNKRLACIDRYNKLIKNNLDKSKEWWMDTHGVDVLNDL